MLKSPAIVGYQHCIWSFTCGQCGAGWFFPSKPNWREPSWHSPTFPVTYKCTKCGATNKFLYPGIQPNIPLVLYLGHDKDRQLEIHPVPSGMIFAGSAGYFPYSTRSFIHQASQKLRGCSYTCWADGQTLGGEPVFMDLCGVLGEEDCQIADQRCQVFAGWPRSEYPCQLWERVADLCQTDDERNFLRYYLSLVKGRNFPMLIPQARIGPAERRRPDFVLFAPLHNLRYRRYAIELDGGHIGNDYVASDQQRNLELTANGYVVLSLRSGEQGYFKELQNLVEQVTTDMHEAEYDPQAIAVEREIHSYE